MLKPMAKKSGMLPSPQTCLEEWQLHAQRQGAMIYSSPHGAASRIQQRYRKYREKVRALLKKQQKQQSEDALAVQEQATASVKNVLRERGVKGSSMALAVAIKARNGGDTPLSATTPTQVLVTKPKGYEPERTGMADATRSWKPSSEWEAQQVKLFQQQQEQEEEEQIECDAEDVTKGVKLAVIDDTATECDEETSSSEGQAEVVDKRHGFVNAMEPSWLVATMEERCAEAAASLGAVDRTGCGSLRMLDVRHSVLDLLFIFKSGHSYNFLGRRPSPSVVHRRNLLQRVAKAKEGGLSHDEHRRVERIFKALRSEMYLSAVRCLGWILTKTWRVLFHGLHIDVDSLERVRRTLEATEGNVSIVFAPTHKTHLDYLIISYVCFAYGIPLPRIAAGNNLDLPLLGSFLRSSGSFFIRRSFRDDPLYKKVLHHYVHELLEDGNPIEVFVEGGRSRHGRVCKPRLGFLSMFSDYAHSASDEDKDVLLVPISLDYDKVFEVEEYANQLLGKPKEKESLKVFFQSVWDLLFLRCGHSYVRFGEPVSIKAAKSLDDVATTLAVRLQTTGTLTSTALVSAVLMWKRTCQTKGMVAERTTWLLNEMAARGATVAHLDEHDVVAHALSILRVPVGASNVVEPKLQFPTRALELGFYRNHLLHVFLPEMAVTVALQSLLLEHADLEPSFSLDEVVQKSTFAWSFLLHICRHEQVDVEQTVKGMVDSQACLDWDATESVRVDRTKWRQSKLVGFVLSLAWPFMDSLWLATEAFVNLVDGSDSTKDREMIRRVQFLAKSMFQQGTLVHAEALCSESIKQSFEFLEEAAIIASTPSADGRGRVLRVCAPSKKTVEDLAASVNGMRKPLLSLWKPMRPAATASTADTQAAMTAAASTASVYDAWMAH
ncbi:TPA: hypothetical protein N0F65_004721 [Lagenidium giganteum]|uniref:Phospholipid/glycerol acyltransferase domain-containing protein n=1 Tax=Lagenidium giganteum TaxID=4803 RepID=A0AAV2Z342_9STRA|nr:TPA: hypothetical protein N0F65_004721 [Lagenidium giganteum]